MGAREHGIGYENRLYRIWHNMKMRCSPKVKSNPLYKLKGIEVCTEWDDFPTFQSWALENGYTDELTIDRINNGGNYTPENCRWVDRLIQNNNRAIVIKTDIDGVERTLTQHAQFYKLANETVRKRYHRGLRGLNLVKAPYQK